MVSLADFLHDRPRPKPTLTELYRYVRASFEPRARLLFSTAKTSPLGIYIPGGNFKVFPISLPSW